MRPHLPARIPVLSAGRHAGGAHAAAGGAGAQGTRGTAARSGTAGARPLSSKPGRRGDAPAGGAERGRRGVRPQRPVRAGAPAGERAARCDCRRACDRRHGRTSDRRMTLDNSESEKRGWFQRLKAGLTRTSTKITGSITGIFTKKKLDRALLDELEEALIAADLGPATAARLTEALAKDRFDKEITEHEVREIFAAEIATILKPVAQPLILSARKPHVVLVIGVNGSGKTTTIGKLAQSFKRAGKTVMLAAGDTFRAAAVEQLKIWGERAGVKVIARETGADAAGLAYDALVAARNEGVDLLLIDTAGRLQNKTDLMAELQKILRVIRKLDPEAPHSTLLVLDATTGQNAHSQVEIFKAMCNVSGLIVTKLDGSAKGGVLVALAEKFKLPVHAVGVGETAEDLRPFDAEVFAKDLMDV
ncbi:MAG: signal recognition particle-docking protein FtsY [Rhodospirillum sp.]|nr:signal recognition particle-docking protein FtsY [Rhodospirillum sp.]